MCWDISERALLHRLRVARYGETGFCCVHCACTEGVPIKGRERSQRCRACKRQQSVTAGTPLHASKLPLRAWFIRGGHFECGNVPTSGNLKAEVKMGRTAAWHLNQRFMRALHLGRAEFVMGQLVMLMPCRKPKGRDTDENRPPVIRNLLRWFEAQPLGQKHPTVVALTFHGRRPRWTHVALTHAEHVAARSNPVFQANAETEPLTHWLFYHLDEKHGRVCLRWLSRYIDHYLGLYTRSADDPPPDWMYHLTHGPRRRLAELRAEPFEREPEVLPLHAYMPRY